MRGASPFRLAGMMALVYAIQGAWWPLLAVHLEDLGISGRGRGLIFGTMALASLATPMGAGQLADRYLPVQRLLAIITLAGSGLLALIGSGVAVHTGALFSLFLVYWLICAPVYGLSNALAFRNLSDPARQFGRIRLWGTVGWMAIGWVVAGVVGLVARGGRDAPGMPEAFLVGSVVALLFAAYCLLVLPDTPPLSGSSHSRGSLQEGLALVQRRPVALFLATAFGVGLTLPFVYQTIPAYLRAAGLDNGWIPIAMSLSQVPEILGLALLPWLHRRLGLRGTLALGAGAWVVEYAVLAAQPPLWLALVVVPLNGVAIAGFLISGQIYLDGQAPPDRRASMQALHVVVTTGLSSLTGNLLAGELMTFSQGAGPPVFAVPALINMAAVFALLLAFPRHAAPRSVPAQPHTPSREPGRSGVLPGPVRP